MRRHRHYWTLWMPRYKVVCTSIASPRIIPHISILSLKIGQMVDKLVTNPSKDLPSKSRSRTPGSLLRGSMAMLMSRLTTSQQVLGAEALFILDNHPLVRATVPLTLLVS